MQVTTLHRAPWVSLPRTSAALAGRCRPTCTSPSPRQTTSMRFYTPAPVDERKHAALQQRLTPQQHALEQLLARSAQHGARDHAAGRACARGRGQLESAGTQPPTSNPSPTDRMAIASGLLFFHSFIDSYLLLLFGLELSHF